MKKHFENFFVHYGFSARRHNGEISKVLLSRNYVVLHKSWSTSYHPMGNEMVERLNQTFFKMLGTIKEHHKQD